MPEIGSPAALGRAHGSPATLALLAAVALLGPLPWSHQLARADEPSGNAPAPAPQASPTPAPAADAGGATTPATSPRRRTGGLIPGILIGPKVSATLLFPPNLMVGGELKVNGWVGASFEYGVFPTSHRADEYAFDAETWSAGLRFYPFRGSFFVGAVLGRYDITALQVTGFGEGSRLNVKSTYLGPQIGWKWDWDIGLFLGLNLGYGFSLDYTSTLAAPVSGGDLQDLKDNADKYLKPGAPIFTLLELGWLF